MHWDPCVKSQTSNAVPLGTLVANYINHIISLKLVISYNKTNKQIQHQKPTHSAICIYQNCIIYIYIYYVMPIVPIQNDDVIEISLFLIIMMIDLLTC